MARTRRRRHRAAGGSYDLVVYKMKKGTSVYDMTFGEAIEALKQGKRVARSGWNGKGMWLTYSPGAKALPAEKFWAGPNADYARQNGGTADVLPCITMKTATGEILMGWLASQTDMLAEDWGVV